MIVRFICLCADTLGVLARTIGSDNFISLADECIQLGLVGSIPNNLTVKRQYDAPPTCMSAGRRTAGINHYSVKLTTRVDSNVQFHRIPES